MQCGVSLISAKVASRHRNYKALQTVLAKKVCCWTAAPDGIKSNKIIIFKPSEKELPLPTPSQESVLPCPTITTRAPSCHFSATKANLRLFDVRSHKRHNITLFKTVGPRLVEWCGKVEQEKNSRNIWPPFSRALCTSEKWKWILPPSVKNAFKLNFIFRGSSKCVNNTNTMTAIASDIVSRDCVVPHLVRVPRNLY